jgi:hypothetical protein
MNEDRTAGQLRQPSDADARAPLAEWSQPRLERLSLDQSRDGNPGAYEHDNYDS